MVYIALNTNKQEDISEDAYFSEWQQALEIGTSYLEKNKLFQA